VGGSSKYWHRLNGKKVFAATLASERRTGNRSGWLVNPTETKIRRHVKIKAEANPFDPALAGLL
jgi:RNA-directed DNA polymerase